MILTTPNEIFLRSTKYSAYYGNYFGSNEIHRFLHSRHMLQINIEEHHVEI